MFLIAKGFDNWISLLVVLEGVTVDGKGYGEKGYLYIITNFLIVEFDLTNYKIHRGLQSRLGKTRHICL
jgi:hypothetical protein